MLRKPFAKTITCNIDDLITSSTYVGIKADETTNVTAEKMLITFQQKGA